MRDTRDESDGVGNVVSLVKDDNVDVIFGSPSSESKTLFRTLTLSSLSL